MGDYDLKEFRGVTRLFPLGGVVLFPHAVLPLHIFEPRYIQMMNDAILSDRMITIIQPKSPIIEITNGPALESVGCLGHIIQHERLPDGRFNLLLAGLTRVSLVDEIRTPGRLYREASVNLVEEFGRSEVSISSLEELSQRFLQLLDKTGYSSNSDKDLRRVFNESKDPSMMTDLVAQSLGLPPMVKQALLNEANVPKRLEQILSVMRILMGKNSDFAKTGDRDFPPKFSQN
jgi:Lon protease-like protein